MYSQNSATLTHTHARAKWLKQMRDFDMQSTVCRPTRLAIMALMAGIYLVHVIRKSWPPPPPPLIDSELLSAQHKTLPPLIASWWYPYWFVPERLYSSTGCRTGKNRLPTMWSFFGTVTPRFASYRLFSGKQGVWERNKENEWSVKSLKQKEREDLVMGDKPWQCESCCCPPLLRESRSPFSLVIRH